MIATRGLGDGMGIVARGYGVVERIVVLAKICVREALSAILRAVDLESRMA